MQKKILIVDDMKTNRNLLANILKDEYETLMAQNGVEALKLLDEAHDEIKLILLDLVMPEMDGLAVLKELKKRPWSKDVGIIVISSDNSVESQEECFDLGVSDYVLRPFNNRLILKRVKHVITEYQMQQELEQKVERQTEALSKQYKLLLVQAEQLKQSRSNVIDILGTVVEYRNLENGERVQRVKGYTKILANCLMHDFPEYELTDEKVDVIVSASALHDIGKIAIPDEILMKPGRLTEEEFEYMKSHTTKGAEIIKSIKNVWDETYGKVGYEICRYHHERYDGKGYPDGLKGEDIPLPAQIVAVADVYDSLISERVYKSAVSKEQAFQMIMTGECGVFSPKILDCFWKTRKEFEALSTQ